MSSSATSRREQRFIEQFLKDIHTLSLIPTTQKHRDLVVEQYPFDAQLLKLSRLYRASRQSYLSAGGRFTPRLSSQERSLSEQDLFNGEIEFAPVLTELLWLSANHRQFMDLKTEVKALNRFSNPSLFHEQNHRIIWRLIPPPPLGSDGLVRYFNFTESLALTLDVALAVEIGRPSRVFHRMNLLYRMANGERLTSKTALRRYLLAVFYATYCRLELIGRPPEIRRCVDQMFSNHAELNRHAVRRSFELEDSFMTSTIPRWRRFHWSTARIKLKKVQTSHRARLKLPKDPLDAEPELLACVNSVFDHYLNPREA